MALQMEENPTVSKKVSFLLIDIILLTIVFSQGIVFYLLGMIVLSPILFIVLLGIFGKRNSLWFKLHNGYTMPLIKFSLLALWFYLYFKGGIDMSLDHLISQGGPARFPFPGTTFVYALLGTLLVFFTIVSTIYEFFSLVPQGRLGYLVGTGFWKKNHFGIALVLSLLVIISLFFILVVLDYFGVA